MCGVKVSQSTSLMIYNPPTRQGTLLWKKGGDGEKKGCVSSTKKGPFSAKLS
jgi:hypothetical protein